MKRFVTAGALVTAVLLTAVLLTAAQPAAASWLQKSTPVPSGASMWSFSAVSCPSGLFCMAVGATESRLLAETRVHDTWTEVSIPDPGGGQLAGVSCTSTSLCEAVGQFTSGGTTQTLAEAWNGSTWSIQATPNPSGATGSQLNGVSCRSASSCAAVGQFTSGGTTQTLAEAWNGSTWKIRNTPNASGADTSQLNGVSCPAATACEAVGVSQTGSAFSSLAEVWNGSTWKTQATPNRGGSSPSQLDAVSCTAANACTATGTGLAERWTGTTWTVQGAAVPSGSVGEFPSVSCSLVSRCVAVGSVTKSGVSLPLGEFWNGTTWAVDPAQSPDLNVTRSTMSSVSCGTSLTCMGVGFYDTSGGVDAPVASSSLNAQCWRADAQWASARRPGAQRWSASPAATRPR